MQASSDSGTARQTRTEILLAALSVLTVAWVYRQLPRVFFDTDDFINLYQIVNRSTVDYVLQPFGGHLLATRNAIFLLFERVFGPRAEPFFTAALLTHLINVALLFRVVTRLTGSAWVAALGAIAWGTNPIHAGTLGWYSVYGQVLVGTILLFVLDRAARLTQTGTRLPATAPLLWPLLLLLAATSFGVGIAIALVAPLALFLVLPPSRQRTRLCLALVALVLAIPLLYVALDPSRASAAGLPNIRFGIADSLGSALYYWDQTAAMFACLLSYGITTLVLSFAFFPGVVPSPLAIVTTVLALAALLLVFARSGGQTRRWIAALALFALAAYGLIAVGRSIFFQLEKIGAAAASARYHYAATIPLAALLCLIVARLSAMAPAPRGARAALLLLWSVVVLVAYRREGPFLDLHQGARREVATVIAQIDALVERSPDATVYIANKHFVSAGFFINKRPTIFPGWVAIYSIFHPGPPPHGKHVYFVADDPKLVAALAGDRRTAEILVTAEQVPPNTEVLTPAALFSRPAPAASDGATPLNAAR